MPVVHLVERQCDQICQNCATLAKFKNSSNFLVIDKVLDHFRCMNEKIFGAYSSTSAHL